MRLIDADKLKFDMDCNIDFGGLDNRLMVLGQIDNAQTVEERKVGKWIKTGGSFRCSECIAMPEFRDIRELKYCPHCGAEMVGTENG